MISKVRSPDGDTQVFDIISAVLHGETLAQLIFIICLDYILSIDYCMYYSILIKNGVNKFCLDNIIKILTIFFKMIHTSICSSKIKQ